MRQVFLVSYDVSDDARRDRVFKILRGFGDHVQFSVFRCDVTDVELVRLRARLAEAINQREDRVLFADLGPSDGRGETAITTVGRACDFPGRRTVVY